MHLSSVELVRSYCSGSTKRNSKNERRSGQITKIAILVVSSFQIHILKKKSHFRYKSWHAPIFFFYLNVFQTLFVCWYSSSLMCSLFR